MANLKIFHSIKKFFLDVLFPINCFFCQKTDEWICQECLEKIEILDAQVCPYCEKIFSPSGRICPNCKIIFLTKKQNFYLDGLVVSCRYKKNGISRLIHRYKYNFARGLSRPLSKIMLQALVRHNLPLPDVITSVPLHPRRLRWRGFNQSAVLAEEISENLTPGFPIQFSPAMLIRKKFTLPQMKIKDYQARKKNLKNVFAINPKMSLDFVKNKTILLIDDVSTTGSTIFECAKILKQYGAKTVLGAVLARQEWK